MAIHALMEYLKKNSMYCFLQSCLIEKMRATVVLLFASLALALVAAYAADEVSVYY